MDAKQLTRKLDTHLERITTEGYECTARDLATTLELWQQYNELLETLDGKRPPEITTDIDTLAEKFAAQNITAAQGGGRGWSHKAETG